jgi:hypothetical protein
LPTKIGNLLIAQRAASKRTKIPSIRQVFVKGTLQRSSSFFFGKFRASSPRECISVIVRSQRAGQRTFLQLVEDHFSCCSSTGIAWRVRV